MGKRRASGRAIFTSAVLLILVAAAAWTLKARGQKQEEPVTAEAEVPEPVRQPEAEKPPQPEEPKEPPADESEEERAAREREAFAVDYTSKPLLDTTPIKCLTMQVGTTAAEVRFNWMSPDGQAGKVVWNNTATQESRTVDASCEPSATMQGYYVNKAEVADLEPGVIYTYRVGNDSGGWSPEYEYQIPQTEGNNFTFLFVSDAQIGQSEKEAMEVTVDTWDKVVTRLTTYVPEALFMIHGGDQVAEFGNAEQYDGFLNHLGLYGIPLAPVPGNHDIATEEGAEEKGFPTGPYFYEHFNVPNRSEHYGMSKFDKDGDYWFVRKNTLFVVLNSSTQQFINEHEEEVDRFIAANPEVTWRVLIQHYPAYSGVEHNREKINEGITNSMIRMGEIFDFDLILAGHDHVYSRSAFVARSGDVYSDYDYASGSTAVNPEGVMFVTAGTASGCMYGLPALADPLVVVGENEVPTAVKIDVSDTEMHITAYEVDSWTVFDEYTIRKEAGNS